MGQIITGLIIIATSTMLYRSGSRLVGLAGSAIGLFLVWPGSAHVAGLVLDQLHSLLLTFGGALGLLAAAVCGLRIMFGLPALPKSVSGRF